MAVFTQILVAVTCLCCSTYCFSHSVPRAKRQAGPNCLFCDRVSQPHDCTDKIQCESDEQCFTDKYITINGNVFYKVGCRPIPVCNAGQGRSEVSGVKRQDAVAHTCEECCQGEYCNARGCYTSPPKRTECYHCANVNDPSHCEQVKTCQVNEQCFIEEVLTDDFRLKYNLGCVKNHVCEEIDLTQGKRQGGLNAVCSSCCKDSYCNLVCGEQAATTTSKPTTTPTTTSTTTTTPTTTIPTTKTTTRLTTTPKTTTHITTTVVTTSTTPTTTTTTTTTRAPAVCYECEFERDMDQCKHSIKCNQDYLPAKDYTCFSGRVQDNGCFFTAKCLGLESCMALKNRTRHGVSVIVDGFEYDDVECCDGVNCNHQDLVIPQIVKDLHHCN